MQYFAFHYTREYKSCHKYPRHRNDYQLQNMLYYPVWRWEYLPAGKRRRRCYKNCNWATSLCYSWRNRRHSVRFQRRYFRKSHVHQNIVYCCKPGSRLYFHKGQDPLRDRARATWAAHTWNNMYCKAYSRYHLDMCGQMRMYWVYHMVCTA